MLIWLAVIAVTVFLDQLTKYLTILHLKPVDTVPLWEDVLHLTYVENTGAAFGSLKDARWVFMIVSTVAIVAILCYMIYRNVIQKRPLLFVEALALSLIVGGGIGNMIDRTLLGYVVDMIDFRLINFAVFNVADSFVCIGSGLMMLHLVAAMLREGKDHPTVDLPEEITDEEAFYAASSTETVEATEAVEATETVEATEAVEITETTGITETASEDEGHE